MSHWRIRHTLPSTNQPRVVGRRFGSRADAVAYATRKGIMAECAIFKEVDTRALIIQRWNDAHTDA